VIKNIYGGNTILTTIYAPGVEFCSNDWKCMICYIIASFHMDLSLSNSKYISLYLSGSHHIKSS